MKKTSIHNVTTPLYTRRGAGGEAMVSKESLHHVRGGNACLQPLPPLTGNRRHRFPASVNHFTDITDIAYYTGKVKNGYNVTERVINNIIKNP